MPPGQQVSGSRGSQGQEVDSVPSVEMDRTGDDVYEATTRVVRSVMQLSQGVTDNRLDDYLLLVKVSCPPRVSASTALQALFTRARTVGSLPCHGSKFHIPHWYAPVCTKWALHTLDDFSVTPCMLPVAPSALSMLHYGVLGIPMHHNTVAIRTSVAEVAMFEWIGIVCTPPLIVIDNKQ